MAPKTEMRVEELEVMVIKDEDESINIDGNEATVGSSS